MANVGEKSLPRLELFHPFQTLCHGRMRRMRLMTQGVEKQHVEIAELLFRCLRNIALVRNVCRRTEAEAENLLLAVQHGQGRDGQSEEVERLIFNGMKLQTR